MWTRSPNLRIALLSLCFTPILPACSKLGLGGESPTTPSGPPAAGSTIVYNAVGASDADGVGSSVVCLPYTNCPDGNGYVFVAARRLQSQGHQVTVTNLGIPTAVIGPTFQALGQQFGRQILGNFLDSEMPFVSPNATLVTVFAGANDVNTITAALGGGAAGSNPTAYIDQQVRVFGADYTALVRGIQNRAHSARIIALNVPNLAGLPYLANQSLSQKQAAQRLAVGMTTTVINPLASQGITVIDLMCDSRLYQASAFSADGFHPNDAGYATIGDEVVNAVTSPAYPSPRTNCSFMTLVE
jgi:lysophospholipase L1-like esterase